jgi:transposase, IS5 family
MRRKSIQEQYFDFTEKSTLKVVTEYRQKYQALSEVLDANPDLLTLAHRDWARLLSTSPEGRAGYTSEQLLRALLVMFLEGDSYRDVVIRIDTSEFLRHFVRLGFKATMDFTFLNRAFGVLSAETLAGMNQVVATYAVARGKISGEKERLDTTVYETNIHYPTDSSLLWDSFRTLSRRLRQIQKGFPSLHLDHRYHDKKVKKLATFIARNASGKRRATVRQVQRHYRLLIARVRWIHGVGQTVLAQLQALGETAADLAHYLPLVERIIAQADQRVLQGLQVPADQKLYSLFEEHTELLQRGKARKPIEFGHKVMLAQTAEKFIHHYQVLPQRREDPDLLEPALEAHQKLFGHYPDVLAADKGFYQSMEQIDWLQAKIRTVSIPKKGRRNPPEEERETQEAFVCGQRFRAGVEGSISVLKRAFKLGCCLFKGFTHYAASVGLAVLCHNLVLLTRL